MVIGVLLSGIIFGLFAALGTLMMGAPLWLAIILYPLIGSLGSMGFIGLAFLRSQPSGRGAVGEFAVDYLS
jgi:hypothetical protein